MPGKVMQDISLIRDFCCLDSICACITTPPGMSEMYTVQFMVGLEGYLLFTSTEVILEV